MSLFKKEEYSSTYYLDQGANRVKREANEKHDAIVIPLIEENKKLKKEIEQLKEQLETKNSWY